VIAVAALADGSRALSGSRDNTLRLWDLATGETLRTFQGHTHWVTGVAVSSDGQRAASSSVDNTLALWDLDTGNCLARFTADAGVACVALTRDDVAIAGSPNSNIHILEIREQ
jgi:WD40 repeat protein